MDRYDPQAIEAKWQGVWEDVKAFEVPNPEPGAPRNSRKNYVLEMLPYPSGRCTSGICSSTHSGTFWLTSTVAPARTSCDRWATTPSVCPPRTLR